MRDDRAIRSLRRRRRPSSRHLRARARALVRRGSPAGPRLEIETLVILEAHDDPIAQHHTLGGRKVSALDPSLEGPSRPAVRRDGRDDRAGGRAGGDAGSGPHRA